MENVRDYILPTEVVDLSKTESKVPLRKPVNVEYSVVFASGPDFAVRRKTKQSSKVLVFLVSQSQYYIKDEKTEEIESFAASPYARFMADAAEPIELVDDDGRCCWLKSISRGKTFGDELQKMIRRFSIDEGARSAAIKNWPYVTVFRNHYSNSVAKNIKASEAVIKKVLSVCMEYASEDAVKEAYTDMALYGVHTAGKVGSVVSGLLSAYSYGYYPERGCEPPSGCGAELLMEAYGLSGLEEIVREFFEVGVKIFPAYTSLLGMFYSGNTTSGTPYGVPRTRIPEIMTTEKRRFNLRDFKHYLWYESVYQGYADDIDNFMHSWADSLRMQEMIYGKIREKYPENLASCEKKLSYKFSQIKQKIDEKRWGEMVQCMKHLEYTGKEYSIICPKTAADVVDEAQQQSNCVASYVRNIINGECMILFCRRTDSPETSLVTIEIRADGTLGQVKARFNRAPSDEVSEFIDKWYNTKVLCSGIWPEAA